MREAFFDASLSINCLSLPSPLPHHDELDYDLNCSRSYRGGLYSLYSIAHAQFVWDLKTEPEYIRLFQEIWGTEKLLGTFLYLGTTSTRSS